MKIIRGLHLSSVIFLLTCTAASLAHAYDAQSSCDTPPCVPAEYAAADTAMDKLYSQKLHSYVESDQHRLHLDQLAWQKHAKETCGTDYACLTKETTKRIAVLQQADAHYRKMGQAQ